MNFYSDGDREGEWIEERVPSAWNSEIEKVIENNELSGALRFDGLILLLFFPTLIILINKKGILTKNVEMILKDHSYIFNGIYISESKVKMYFYFSF